jgi:ParB-like nuclease family protein
MRVELKSLQPNPMRDFTVDPLDEDRVKVLTGSIKEDGFWGGVVCRKTKNGIIEIAAGHHRVNAAIKAGIKEAEIYIGNIDDASMIRIYARENATQRGNTGTAVAGSVASAIRFLAKAIMTEAEVSKIFDTLQERTQASTSLTSTQGIGQRVVVKFLDGVPGINDGTVQQQLANLKASGDYARIIREVQQEIEQENKTKLEELARREREQAKREEEARQAEAKRKAAEEERKEKEKAARKAKEEADKKRAEAEAEKAKQAEERAKKEAELAQQRSKEASEKAKELDALKKTRDTAQAAATKAESREKTFDFEGVAKYLKNASHIDVFRQLATGEGAKPYLPVNQQAALARELVSLADGGELSGRFIRENFMSLLMGAKQTERNLNANEKADLLKKDWNAKARVYQEEMARHARGFLAAALSLAEHDNKRPKGVTLQATSEFRKAVENINRAIALIEKAGVL